MQPGTTSSSVLARTSSPVARATQSDGDSAQLLKRFIDGFWISCSLQVAAKLRVADHLIASPLQSQALAALTKTHARSLYRLLRALASVGVFAEDERGYFSLTTVGELLISDSPHSLCSFVLEELDGALGRTWEDLLWSVSTGKPARSTKRRCGTRALGWRYQGGNAESGEVLGGAAARLRAAILRDYDFSHVKSIVDVGGGEGFFLAFLLQAHASLHGVVFDRPGSMEETRLCLAAEGVAKRCRVMAGDFLEFVPRRHDLYVLRQVIRDHNDKHVVQLLSNCYRAMPPHGKLLLVESILPPGNTLSLAKFQDLKLMISSEGRERTESELRSLLNKAGLRVENVVPLGAEMYIIETVRGAAR